MSVPLLELRGLHKRFGALKATDGVDLALAPGELHALIGPNGAGKSTLIAQIGGELRPDAGSVWLAGREVTALGTPQRVRRGLARSFQITAVFAQMSALANVALAVQARQGRPWRHLGAAARDERLLAPARALLDRVGLGARAGIAAAVLSHGERRQLELAMALALEPRVLLLDEPMAGMAGDDAARVVELLRGLKQQLAILLVEHDMDAVAALADRVTVLQYGRVIARGSFDAVRADAAVRSAYLGDH